MAFLSVTVEELTLHSADDFQSGIQSEQRRAFGQTGHSCKSSPRGHSAVRTYQRPRMQMRKCCKTPLDLSRQLNAITVALLTRCALSHTTDCWSNAPVHGLPRMVVDEAAQRKEVTDLVRRKACPSSTGEPIASVRRKGESANPSSSEEHSDNADVLTEGV